ncbi:MAG TPA: radical SAM protein [Polyangiaceae bacterium]|nr:radical SAM protein [Polyangiaceae bacterium]
MKVLLVNNGESNADFGTDERRFPIGLGYLSAMLKQHDHEVELVDRFADRGIWIEGDVNRFDFVGVYTSTPCYKDALAVLELLEGFKGRIAFGGPHTTAFPNTVPPRVDYVVQGEAEPIIHPLVEGEFPTGTLLRAQRIDDLDTLPRPDYDIFLDRPRNYTWDIPFTDHKPIYLMNTSRSCPYTCTFCSVRDIWGTLWRAQGAERIVDDIAYLKSKYDMAGVYFREDIFTANKKRVHEICELLIKRNIKIAWACETRVDAGSDPSLIEIMAKSGCKGIYVGAESGSQRMLDHYHKQITVEQIEQTCRLAKKHGIVVAMSLIVDHPMETWRDKFATWKLVKVTRPEIVWRNPYRDDVARHGVVDFPEYAPREVIDLTFQGGTWVGQHHRLMPTEHIANKTGKARRSLHVLPAHG